MISLEQELRRGMLFGQFLDSLGANPAFVPSASSQEVVSTKGFNRGESDPFTNPAARHPMFRDHRCWRCRDGEKPCVQTRPGLCEYPHARND